MIVELHAETERLVLEELSLGHFHSIDDLIQQGVRALRAQDEAERTACVAPREPRENLADFLLRSPLARAELQFERQADTPRTVHF